MEDAKAIESMFSDIAVKYDRTNYILSFGLVAYWRWLLVREIERQQPERVVDLATGSGDVAFALKKKMGAQSKVIGLDFCRPMLMQAEKKRNKLGWAKDIVFEWGNCLDLPLETNSADAVTISFGLRNLENREKGLREMHRILEKSKGRLYVMEFSQPGWLFRGVYYLYLKLLVPTIASVITGNKNAYEYLIGSIAQFPGRQDLSKQIKAAGFSEVKVISMAGGAVALHIAKI